MKPIPERQEMLERFIAEHFPEPREEKSQSNGHSTLAQSTAPAPPEANDGQLLEDLFAEREKGTQWRDCYEGRYELYYPSPSEAVAALLLKLAFYSDRNAGQMERLIRGSGLASAKFDDRRGGTTWIRSEVQKAAKKTTETRKAKPQDEVRSRSRSLGREVMSNDPEHSIRAVSFRGRKKPGPREWIVDRAVCKGHPASWFGESGIAKSLLALHMGLHVAGDGIDYWAGLRVRTTPVLYIDFELDEIEHLRRAQELAAGMGLQDVPAKFHYLCASGLTAAEAFEIAAEECERLRAGLSIVDSVGFALDGDSELAKAVLRFHREYIQPIKDAGATPLLIDHQAKVIKGEKYSDKQEFGSVYKTNAVRSSFQIRGAWDGNELTTTFTHKKTNFGPKVEDFSLKLVFAQERIEVRRLEEAIPNPDREPSKKEQVFAAVEELGRATAETVHNKTDINLQTVRNAISELVSEGALEDTGEKQGRSRIVVTHSQSTKGTGTGTKAQGATSAEGVPPAQQAQIDKMVSEGWAPHIARQEVLGKAWVPE